MARSRITRPEFLERADRATLSRDAQFLFLLMQLLADDYGRLLDSPKAIAGGAFPLDDEFTAELAKKCLDELEAAGWLRRYIGDDRKCIVIERWVETQKVNNKTPSTLPDPECPGDSVSGTSHENFTNDSGESQTSVSAFASVHGSAFASVPDKEIVDSRVTTTGAPISSSPSRENEEDDKPITPAHRRELIAATATLANHFDGTYPTEKVVYPVPKVHYPLDRS
jgi:hypothetical protein